MQEDLEKNLEGNIETDKVEKLTSNDLLIITERNTNCYLIKISDGFVLIDTGFTNKRSKIEKTLVNAGCKPGNLKLILLTHGDFDHTGNCAYFRDKFDAKIAMHKADSGMVEYGDFFWSRENLNIVIKTLFKAIVFILRMNLKKKDRFKADIFLDEGDNLSKYGFDARVIHFPGHSKGSIGFLTSRGELFCGDLLENTKQPAKFSMIDNHKEYENSLEKLKLLEIQTVYPGHGKPFLMKSFM